MEEITTSNLSNKEVVGSALSTTALFAPGAGKGASLTAKVAAGGATGYAMDVGNKLQDTNKTTKQQFTPGIGTAIGVTLPVLGAIFGKAPGALETANQRMTPNEKRLLGAKGKEVSKLLVDKRVVGTPEQRFDKVSRLYDDAEEKVSKLVESSKATYKKDAVVEKLNAIKDTYLDNPAEYDQVAAKIDKVVDFFQTKTQGELTASQINKFKRSFWSAAYNEKGNKIVSDALHDAGGVMKGLLDDSIPTLSKVNKDYGVVIAAKKLLDVARTRNQAGVFGRAAGFMGGSAVGAAMGNPLLGGSAGAYIGQKGVNMVATPVRSVAAVGINEVTKLLEKIPTDKLGNLQLTRKALIQLLSGK